MSDGNRERSATVSMGMRISGTGAAALAAATFAAAMLALAGCAAAGNSGTARPVRPTGAASAPVPLTAPPASARPRTLTRTSARPGTASALGQSIYRLTLDNPSMTVTSAGLYLTWYRPRPNGSVAAVVLARADAATGVIMAQRDFSSGVVGAPLLADGSLWVTDSVPGPGATPSGSSTSGRQLLLLRLNPATLALTGKLAVGGASCGGANTGAPGQVAFAGGAIWMDGAGLLVRVDPESVTRELTVVFPGADSSAVGASPDGTVLIVAETCNGIGTVQRRDPVTGALLASRATNGIAAPAIAGVTDGRVWLAAPTGMMGYAERLGTASLSPARSTEVIGTNAIHVRVADGALWLTDPVGGATRNYCADPVTGRVRAPLPLPDLGQDELLAVGAGVLYYAAFDSSGNGWRIATAPVPAACA